MRFFLIGFMGSGKSHWGKQLSKEFKMPFVDLDEAIVEDVNMEVTEIFTRFGEEYFRNREKELLEKIVEANKSLVLSCGGGTACFFNNIEFMRASGTVIWLNTRVEVLLERLIEGKKERPVIKDITEAELKDTIIRKLNERRMYYDQAHIVIDNESTISTGELSYKLYYMHKGFLITGFVLGAIAVALGALGAHKLKEIFGPELASTFDTDVKYHFYHTLALIITAILYGRFRSKTMRIAAYLFIGGILFFSGSIYLLTFLKGTNTVGLSGIGFLTPLGGLLFIAGWLCLAWSVYKDSNNSLKAI